MSVNQRYHPLDANLLFGEDKTLTASDVVADGNNNDVVLDLGVGREDFDFVVDVSNIDINDNNEKYTLLLQGSNTQNFSGAKENIAVIELGATEVRAGGAQDSTIGRYVGAASSSLLQNFRYVRLNVLIAGTTPTITFTSWLAPRS